MITNAGSVSLASYQGGIYNRLTLENGARLFNTNTIIGNNGDYNTMIVRSTDALWDNGGGVITIGTSAGSSACSSNELLISDGGVITNAGGVRVGYRTGRTGFSTRGNRLVVSGGSRLFSGGALIGNGHTIPVVEDNGAVVVGAGSLWVMDGPEINIGYGSQGNATNNWMIVSGGGLIMTGTGLVYVGRANARNGYLSTLAVTNGGTLLSWGRCFIGFVNSGGTAPYSACSNLAVVAGGPEGNAVWDLNGASLAIGSQNKLGSSAVGNRLLLGAGGTVFNAGDITVGNALPSYTSIWNRITLAGGPLYGRSLTLHPSNVLEVVLGPDGFLPMTLTSTVTLAANSYLYPTNLVGAKGGTYTVLTAASISDGGLRLHPEANSALWSFAVTDGNKRLIVTYSPPPQAKGSVFMIR